MEANANVIVGKVVPIILELPYARQRYYNPVILTLSLPYIFFIAPVISKCAKEHVVKLNDAIFVLY